VCQETTTSHKEKIILHKEQNIKKYNKWVISLKQIK